MNKYLKPLNRRNSISIIDDMFNNFLIDPFRNPLSLLDNRVASNYNIKQMKEGEYIININVAGFNKEDIEISLDDETLIIRGSKKEEEKDGDYIYQGFSSSFTNSFTLGSGAEIKNATIKDGVLSIEVKEKLIENKKVRNIPIK